MSTKILDDFCGESFWDSSVSWNTDNPILSRCFRQIALSIFPCILFLIIVPFEMWFNINPKDHPPVVWTWIGYSRFIVAIAIALLSLINLFAGQLDQNFSVHYVIPSRDFLSPLFQVITFVSNRMNESITRLHNKLIWYFLGCNWSPSALQ